MPGPGPYRGGKRAGMPSYNSVSGRKCLVAGCKDMRLARGYCLKHQNELSSSSHVISVSPSELVMPLLRQLNDALTKTPVTRGSPYLQALLGSIRHLMISVDKTGASTRDIKPVAEGDGATNAKEKESKKDKNKDKPFQLPSITYRDIFELNANIANLINSPHVPSNLAALTYGTTINKKSITPEVLAELSNVYDKAPIVDVQVTFSRKDSIPAGYTVLSKTLTGKTADLNTGAGGRDVYLCYLRRPDYGPCIYSSAVKAVDATDDDASPSASASTCDSPRATSQLQSSSPKNVAHSSTNVSLWQPLTALTVFFPDVHEEAPFGFELVSCTASQQAASLNSGTNSARSIYVALHRAGPAPDYDMYAQDMLNATNRPILSSLHRAGNAAAHSAELVDAFSNSLNLRDSSGSADALRWPLTVLSEADRAKGNDNPIVGPRGCGAPIVDLGVLFLGKEPMPADWHEVRWSALGHKGNLNSGTDGQDSRLVYRVNVVPVLEKVYVPFVRCAEAKKGQVSRSPTSQGCDATVGAVFARACAAVTACLYSGHEHIVMAALEAMHAVPLMSCPAHILNALLHTVADAVPCFLSYFTTHSHTALLKWFIYMLQHTFPLLSVYTISRVFDICYLLRHEDKVTGASKALIDALITEANKASTLLPPPGSTCPIAKLDPLGSYPQLTSYAQTIVGAGGKKLVPALTPSTSGADTAPSTPKRGDTGLGDIPTLASLASAPASASSPSTPEKNSQSALRRLPPPLNTRLSHELDESIDVPSELPDLSAVAGEIAQQRKSKSDQPFSPSRLKQANLHISPCPTPVHSAHNTPLASSPAMQRLDAAVKTAVDNINANPYDMCAALVRALADKVIDSKLNDVDAGRLLRRPFGSQSFADIVLGTDRLVANTHNRNWLTQPPAGYTPNPALFHAHPAYANTVADAVAPVGTISTPSTPSSRLTSFAFAPSAVPEVTVPPTVSEEVPLGVPTLASLASASSASGAFPECSPASSLASPAGSPAATLSATLQARKRRVVMHTQAHTLTSTPSIPDASSSPAPRYTAYTRVFHPDPDVDARGQPYEWKFIKLQRPELQHETEQERRRRRKREKEAINARMDEIRKENEQLHERELAYRRYILYSTAHAHTVPSKAERALLSVVMSTCKVACSSLESLPAHPSSFYALQNVTLNNQNTPQFAFAHLLPYYLTEPNSNRSELAKRRAHALALLLHMLQRADGFFRSNPSCITVLRRYVMPTLMLNCTVADNSAIFRTVLQAFVVISTSFRKECMTEIGIFIDRVLLELLLNPLCSLEMKKDIMEALEHIVETPSSLINLYNVHDHTGYRNVYEKLIRTLTALVQGRALSTVASEESTGPHDSLFENSGEPQAQKRLLTTTEGGDIALASDVALGMPNTTQNPLDGTAESLSKLALRFLVQQLHMLAQWVGVPSLKRTEDAAQALQLTCMSFLHVLVNSDSFPLFFSSTPEYAAAIQRAARRAALTPSISDRAFIQARGVLEEVLNAEGKRVLKKQLGFHNGITRRRTTVGGARLSTAERRASMATNPNTLANVGRASICSLSAQAQEAAADGRGRGETLATSLNQITAYGRREEGKEGERDTSLTVEEEEEESELFSDGTTISIDKVLGELPKSDIEMGMDLGLFMSMDRPTARMVGKLNCAAMLTTHCPSLAERQRWAAAYAEASQAVKGKDNVKDLLKLLKDKYPHMLTPHTIAKLLFRNPAVDETVLGDFLSNYDDKWFNTDQYAILRSAYVQLIDFTGMSFVAALRYFLTSCGFRLPGEGQKIDRLIEAFCDGYCRDNPDEFNSSTAAHVVCFSVIMLNTDLNDPRLKNAGKKTRRMTLREFMNNLRDCNDGQPLDPLFLTSIYTSIAINPIVWDAPALAIPGAPAPSAGIPPPPPSNDDPHMVRCLYRAHRAYKQQNLSAIFHKAMCEVRATNAFTQRSDFTMSTQIVAPLWQAVWTHFVAAISTKVETSPFFSSAASTASAGLGAIDGVSEVDIEMLHWCIDGLAYASAVCMCINSETARQVFNRVLSKVTFVAQLQASAGNSTVDRKLLYTKLGTGDHLRQSWVTEVQGMSSVGACKQILQVAMRTKHSISFHRRQQILKQLETDFGGQVQLVSPSRSFVKEGKLIKLSSTGKKQEYVFFLFSDLLIYASEAIQSRFKLHRAIHLSLLRIVDLPHHSTPHAFKIISPQKSFVIVASSAEDKEAWIHNIIDCVKLVLIKRHDWIHHMDLKVQGFTGNTLSLSSSASDIASDKEKSLTLRSQTQPSALSTQPVLVDLDEDAMPQLGRFSPRRRHSQSEEDDVDNDLPLGVTVHAHRPSLDTPDASNAASNALSQMPSLSTVGSTPLASPSLAPASTTAARSLTLQASPEPLRETPGPTTLGRAASAALDSPAPAMSPLSPVNEIVSVSQGSAAPEPVEAAPASTPQDRLRRYATFTLRPNNNDLGGNEDHCRLCLFKFTLFRRRVACPFCAQTVCNECIDHRAHIPGQRPNVQHKVCDACWGFLIGMIGDNQQVFSIEE